MKSELSGVELTYLLQELEPRIVGGRLDQVYQPGKDEVLLIFHKSGEGKSMLRIRLPKLVYLTTTKPSMPQPKGFCMYLRKQVKGARITAINLLGFERIIEMHLEYKEEQYRLLIELIPPGNVILVKEEKILVPLNHQDWKDRSIRPGKPYSAPQRDIDPRELTKKQLESLMGDLDIVKVLAAKLGLGGRYAEEVLLRTGIEKNKQSLTSAEMDLVVQEVKDIFTQKIDAQIVTKGEDIVDITPFALKSQEKHSQQAQPSFNEALDSILTEHVQTVEKQSTQKKKLGKRDKLLGVIEKQKKYIGELEDTMTIETRKGELIYEKYQEVQQILDQLKEARKTLSWKEIKEKLKGHEIVKQINEKNGKIVLEFK